MWKYLTNKKCFEQITILETAAAISNKCEVCGAKLKAMELESHLATGGCEEYLENK